VLLRDDYRVVNARYIFGASAFATTVCKISC